MKTSELIEQLKQQPPEQEALVAIDGGETVAIDSVDSESPSPGESAQTIISVRSC